MLELFYWAMAEPGRIIFSDGTKANVIEGDYLLGYFNTKNKLVLLAKVSYDTEGNLVVHEEVTIQ